MAAGASGNRTGLVDTWTAPGQQPVTTSTTYCHDWADRLLSSTVVNPISGASAIADGIAPGEIAYDAAGDITRLGDATFAYDALGFHAATTWDNGTIVSVRRDASGRVIETTTDPAGDVGPVVTSLVYAGGGDVPYARLGAEGVSRPVNLPGGAMATIAGAGTDWSFPSILGHAAMTSHAGTSSGIQLYDPYGQPLASGTFAIGTTATAGAAVNVGATGWHQSAAKSADTSGSFQVVEMGQRVYVAALGRFLQVDPVEGGVENDYIWPTDPIGKSDLSGTFDWDVALAIVDVVAIALMFVPGVGTAAGLAIRGVTTVARGVRVGMAVAREVVVIRRAAIAFRAGALPARAAVNPGVRASERAAAVAGRWLTRGSRSTTLANGQRMYSARGWTYRTAKDVRPGRVVASRVSSIGVRGMQKSLHIWH